MCLVDYKKCSEAESKKSRIGYKVYRVDNDGVFHSLSGFLYNDKIGKLKETVTAENRYGDPNDADVGFHIIPNLKEAKELRDIYRRHYDYGESCVVVRVRYTDAKYKGATKWTFNTVMGYEKFKNKTVTAQTMTMLNIVKDLNTVSKKEKELVAV